MNKQENMKVKILENVSIPLSRVGSYSGVRYRACRKGKREKRETDRATEREGEIERERERECPPTILF